LGCGEHASAGRGSTVRDAAQSTLARTRTRAHAQTGRARHAVHPGEGRWRDGSGGGGGGGGAPANSRPVNERPSAGAPSSRTPMLRHIASAVVLLSPAIEGVGGRVHGVQRARRGEAPNSIPGRRPCGGPGGRDLDTSRVAWRVDWAGRRRSPVMTITRMPAFAQSAIAAGTSGRGGSCRPTSPTNVSPLSMACCWIGTAAAVWSVGGVWLVRRRAGGGVGVGAAVAGRAGREPRAPVPREPPSSATLPPAPRRDQGHKAECEYKTCSLSLFLYLSRPHLVLGAVLQLRVPRAVRAAVVRSQVAGQLRAAREREDPQRPAVGGARRGDASAALRGV
jgi:hypothetical protein